MAKNKQPGSASQAGGPSGPPMSADELSRYAAGELSTDAQHDVENRLLDSALHRDAAEGFAAAGAPEAATAYQELLDRLQERVNNASASTPASAAAAKAAPAAANAAATSSLGVPEAAPQLSVKARNRRKGLIYGGVALLLMAILVPLFLYRSYNNLKDEDAAAAKRRRAANYRGEDAEPKGFFDKLFGDDEPSPEEIAAKRTADSLKAVAQAQAVADARVRAEADAARQRDEDAARQREEDAARQRAAAATAAASARAAAPAAPAEPTVRRMRGQVTTDAGVPIAGATVTLRATGRKASAGADGWFSMEVPSGTDPTLDVEAPGFVARTTRASGEQINVRLSTAEAVAVQSMTSAVAAEKRIRTVRPEPEGGYGAFYRYLAGAAKMPDQARKEKVSGQVQVEFQVNPNGTLTDFRVVQGLGFGCDEEAVRVIQDGPKWSPGKANGEPIIKKVVMPVPFGR